MEYTEYSKYCDMVQEFKECLNLGKVSDMPEFMKYRYGLEGDAALVVMRKIQDIVYKGYVSKKEKRNRRRETRRQYFKDLLNL